MPPQADREAHEEKSFAQLGQTSMAEEAQGEGVFLEESSGQSEFADLKHQLTEQASSQEEQAKTAERSRPPPSAIRKAMVKAFTTNK